MKIASFHNTILSTKLIKHDLLMTNIQIQIMTLGGQAQQQSTTTNSQLLPIMGEKFNSGAFKTA